jgi:hypothetical protein
VLALIESINTRVEECDEQPRNFEDLREQFDMLWPKLEETLGELKSQALVEAPGRDIEDMLKEVLETVRVLARESPPQRSIPEWAVTSLQKAEAAGPPVPAPFVRGERIVHPIHGEGAVEKCLPSDDGKRWRVRVLFDKAGRKWLDVGVDPIDRAPAASS